MDPIPLEGKFGALLQQFVDVIPKVSNSDELAQESKSMSDCVEEWKLAETRAEAFLEIERKNDKEFLVFKKGHKVALDLEEHHLEMEVVGENAEEEKLEALLWKNVAFKKLVEIRELQKNVEELREEVQELQVWRHEAKALVVDLEQKSLEMETLRRKVAADKLRTEEAHQLECDALRLKAQRTESVLRNTFENFRTALRASESKYSHQEQELSETHLRSVESMKLAACGQNEGPSVPITPQNKRRSLELLEAVEQYVDDKYKRRRL